MLLSVKGSTATLTVELPESYHGRMKRAMRSQTHPDKQIVQFIRVGVDSGYGGRQSRMFPYRHYHFIPIPKHNDPEFCKFTYGDMATDENGKLKPKGSSLMKLRRGDFLVFYAGFEGSGTSRCVGIFAYLVVEHAYLLDRSNLPISGVALSFAKKAREYKPFKSFKDEADPETWQRILVRYKKFSEHVESKIPRKEMEVLICGDPDRSYLLPNVEILAPSSSSGYIVSPEISSRLGLTDGADLKRSSVRTVKGDSAQRAIVHLKKLSSGSAA
jgi:hypothetical protein